MSRGVSRFVPRHRALSLARGLVRRRELDPAAPEVRAYLKRLTRARAPRVGVARSRRAAGVTCAMRTPSQRPRRGTPGAFRPRQAAASRGLLCSSSSLLSTRSTRSWSTSSAARQDATSLGRVTMWTRTVGALCVVVPLTSVGLRCQPKRTTRTAAGDPLGTAAFGWTATTGRSGARSQSPCAHRAEVRQVAAYLVQTAVSLGARLATFDARVVTSAVPKAEGAVFVIP